MTDPAVTVTSTNNVAASKTVTMKMSDGQSGIAGYYCGTANPATTAVTYTAFTGSQIDYQVTGNGTYYFSAKDAAGNVTTKTLTFHKLVLNANGGSCGLGQLVGLKGNNISLPAASRTGYTYQGWADTNNATTGSTTSQFTADRTLYTAWKVNTYQLYFNVNATGASCSPTSKTVAYDTAYGALPTPTKSYCTFAGWFTDPNGGSQVNASTKMGAGDTTVYAHWNYPNYTLYFNANGGTCGEGSRVVRYESAYGALPTPARTGHTFNGWFTDPNGGSQVSANTIMGGGNATVYAHWTANNYTLTFNANGGSCTETSRTVAYGAAYGTLPTPTKTDATFKGWYTSKSGGSQVSVSTTMGGGNTTVYAHWSAKVPATNVLRSTQSGFTKVTVTLPKCNDYKNCQPIIYIREGSASGTIIAKLVKEVNNNGKYTLSADLDPNKTYYVEAGWYDAETTVECRWSTCPHYTDKITVEWTYE